MGFETSMYRNVAYGFVPSIGTARVEWSPERGAQLTRVFTDEVVICAPDEVPESDGDPDDPELPDRVLKAIVLSEGFSITGDAFFDGPATATWIDEPGYHYARGNRDIRLSDAQLLRFLSEAADQPWWRCRVEIHEDAARGWYALLRALNPDDDREWLIGHVVEAGDVRTILRAAEHLMPADAEASLSLRLLLSDDSKEARYALQSLQGTYHADTILQYGVFGRRALGVWVKP